MQRDNIKTIKADACKTRLPDDDIDIVFLHLVLHDIKDKTGAIKEFYRVLKVSGKLVIDEEGVISPEEVIRLVENEAFRFSRRLYKTLQVFEKPSTALTEHEYQAK